MQRASIAEELAESIRVLEARMQEAFADGLITDMERALLAQEFARTKRQARTLLIAQATGIRLMRTGLMDKNLVTDINAVAQDHPQGKGRILQFENTAQRRRRSSGGTDDAA